MFIRCVVDDQIDQHLHAALFAAVRKFDEIAERAICRIDVVVVGYIVPAIAARRRLKRHEPDRCDAEALQIVEPAHQAFEVTDTVAIGIHECGD